MVTPPHLTSGGREPLPPGNSVHNAPVDREFVSQSSTVVIVLTFAAVLALINVIVSFLNVMWGDSKKEEDEEPSGDADKKETTYNNKTRDRINLAASVLLFLTVSSGIYFSRNA